MKSILFVLLSSFVLLLPVKSRSQYIVDTIPLIYNIIAQVDTALVTDRVQHLQDYGTRDCLQPEAVQVQNWIFNQLEGFGLTVEFQNFPYYIYDPSDNVIATLPGKVHSDEYVVVGAHYDSRAWGSGAPGADDNASGTSAVIEAARILSQYDFERTIIFCTFSAEEYGLIGSEAYAVQCEQQGMDILGYFNFDMIGYRDSSITDYHTTLIYPATAEHLAQFYKDVAHIYLPEFGVYDGSFTSGDSDHTSFNNHGYMGIFPFEDIDHYSPYIHSDQDIIGKSYNDEAQAVKFVQANIASIVTLAVPYDPTVIDEGKKDVFVNLYPNPARDILNIVLPEQNKQVTITLFSSEGKKLIEQKTSSSMQLNLNGIQKGLCILKINGEKLNKTFKVNVF